MSATVSNNETFSYYIVPICRKEFYEDKYEYYTEYGVCLEDDRENLYLILCCYETKDALIEYVNEAAEYYDSTAAVISGIMASCSCPGYSLPQDTLERCHLYGSTFSPLPGGSGNGGSGNEESSMTAEQIAEQRAEEMQKAIEETIAAEEALPVTEFLSESAVNSIPATAKSTGASANLSKITTIQGFTSAVTKLAASAKASITNRNGVASVTVYTDRPMTFSTDMLDAIYATDINFEYVFRYEGKLYKITIPRGVKVDLGESRYEGPLCVGKILGTTQVIE